MITNIYNELFNIRKNENLTIAGLARKLNLQYHVISDIENPDIDSKLFSILLYLAFFNKTIYISDYDVTFKINPKDIAGQLKMLREKVGVTQFNLASATNTSQHVISRMESIKNYNPTWKTYVKFIYSLALDLSIGPLHA